MIVHELLSASEPFESKIRIGELEMFVPFIDHSKDGCDDADNVARPMQEKGCKLREWECGCGVCLCTSGEVERGVRKSST